MMTFGKNLAGALVIVVTVTCVSACGTAKVASSPQNTTAPLDKKISGSVPDRYRDQPLIIATDASLAPMELVAGKRKSIVGADIDIVNALASTMGLKVIIQNVDFNKIVSGVNSGAYDLGVSSITDTPARETKVDFVTYFQAGISYYVRKGAAKVAQPADLCGQRVAVQDGTILIHAPRRPRSGWSQAFELMARTGDDQLLDAQTPATRWDEEEWEWK